MKKKLLLCILVVLSAYSVKADQNITNEKFLKMVTQFSISMTKYCKENQPNLAEMADKSLKHFMDVNRKTIEVFFKDKNINAIIDSEYKFAEKLYQDMTQQTITKIEEKNIQKKYCNHIFNEMQQITQEEWSERINSIYEGYEKKQK